MVANAAFAARRPLVGADGGVRDAGALRADGGRAAPRPARRKYVLYGECELCVIGRPVVGRSKARSPTT